MAKSYCERCGTRHGPGNCPMDSDTTRNCPKCGRPLDRTRLRGGHSGNCPIYIAGQLAPPPPRGRAHPRVTIPAHSGNWKKTGRMKNELGVMSTYWRCQTCQRTTFTSGETPTSACPEIRGRA